MEDFQGANILHKSLIEEGINSVLLNDTVLHKRTKQRMLKKQKKYCLHTR